MQNLFGEEIEQESDIAEEKPVKPKTPSLFDYLNSINSSKKDLSVRCDVPGFEPFIICKGLGQSKSTIGFANILNRLPNIPNIHQYRFLLHGLPKNKSYAKWAKSKHEKNLKQFMEATKLPRDKSIDAMKILSKEQIKRILKPVGGKVNNK